MFKQKGLVISLVMSLILYFIVIYYPENIFRKIITIPLVLYVPGYLTLRVLFCKGNILNVSESIAISFGLSISIVPLLGLLLNYTTSGLTLSSMLNSLVGYNLIIGTLALYLINK
ncbi:DUF1616 domain-containing protein [Methanococcus maripaludis]|jgi:uncharacterized membrane protein|uniref:DUF1616 domain-containing protein n=1 Tax=Methanococcus maripaludis TaxID=39152 RepID=UPI0011BEEF13